MLDTRQYTDIAGREGVWQLETDNQRIRSFVMKSWQLTMIVSREGAIVQIRKNKYYDTLNGFRRNIETRCLKWKGRTREFWFIPGKCRISWDFRSSKSDSNSNEDPLNFFWSSVWKRTNVTRTLMHRFTHSTRGNNWIRKFHSCKDGYLSVRVSSKQFVTKKSLRVHTGWKSSENGDPVKNHEVWCHKMKTTTMESFRWTLLLSIFSKNRLFLQISSSIHPKICVTFLNPY